MPRCLQTRRVINRSVSTRCCRGTVFFRCFLKVSRAAARNVGFNVCGVINNQLCGNSAACQSAQTLLLLAGRSNFTAWPGVNQVQGASLGAASSRTFTDIPSGVAVGASMGTVASMLLHAFFIFIFYFFCVADGVARSFTLSIVCGTVSEPFVSQ